MEKLGFTIPEYSRPDDPTMARRMVEWTILDSEVQTMRRLYEKTCCKGKKKKSDKEKFSNFKKLKREPGIDDVQCNMKDVKDIKTEIKVEIEVNGITTTAREVGLHVDTGVYSVQYTSNVVRRSITRLPSYDFNRVP
ncbi:hypothetical protein J6590_061922 [Homalodisca vitripennis]|nr:hypothetical protein J6590_061922 [Homalodisca vitripennis]